jgi:outer membrane lipoprotein-sorting protein
MSARTRWAVPAGVVAAVGVTIGATAVANAAQPSLPALSVAQLLADVQQASATPQGPLTATILQTANLGLPALPQIGAIAGQAGQLGSLSPLAGTTAVSIWYLNPNHVRIAQEVQMGESDLRLDGTTLWLWNSKTQTATHVLLPRAFGNEARPYQRASASTGGSPLGVNMSPLTAARQALAQVGPSTKVALGPNVTVAGRAAYQISISPRTSGSLVSEILIAIDAVRHIPLRVEVIARDSSSPAFEVGYTALAFGPPAMSNFSFTPPPGAQVKTVTIPNAPAGLNGSLGLHGLGLGALGLGALGSAGFAGLGSQSNVGVHVSHISCAKRTATCVLGPGTVNPGGPDIQVSPAPALPKSALKRIEASFAAHLPKSMTTAQRAAAIKAFEQNITGVNAGQNNAGMSVNTQVTPAPVVGSPKALGKDWTSVLATPANPAVAAAVQQLLSAAPQVQTGQGSFTFGSSSQAVPGGPGGPIPVGPDLAVLRALLQASTPVHGSWGSGRLLQSALLSVLVTSNGRVLAGAVTPSVLYADAASLSR